MGQRSRTLALKAAAWIAAALALLAAVGFLVVPPVARPYLEKAASEALGRQVSIEALRFNPFLLSTRIQGILVGAPQSQEPAFSVEELQADLSWSSLLRAAPVLSSLRVAAPRLKVVRLEANRYDWSDVIDRMLSRPAGEPAMFSLSSVAVERGEIDFDDRPEKKRHEVRELRLDVPFVSSLAAFRDRDVEPSFSAKVNGTPVQVSGAAKPFDASHRAALAVEFGKVDLARYADYAPLPLKAKLASGTVEGRLELGFAQDQGKVSTLRVGGRLAFDAIELLHASGERLASLGALALDIESLDLVGRVLVIRQVQADRADLRLSRDAKGKLSVAALVSPVPQPGNAPFLFEIGELALKDSRLGFQDEAAAGPFRFEAQELTASARDLSNRDGRKGEVQASFKSVHAESASVEMSLSLAPLAAQGRFELKGFGASRYAPYYSPLLAAEIEQGALSASGGFAYAAPGEGRQAELRFIDAAARLSDLRVTRHNAEVLRLAELDVSAAQIDLERRTVALGSVSARKGRIAAARDASGTVDLTQLAVPGKGGDAPGAPWTIGVGKLAVEGIDVDWSDATPKAPVKLSLGTLSLAGENLSTQRGARGSARVTLVSGPGRLSLAGPLQLDPLSAQLAVEAADFGIVAFQPYLAGVLNVGLRNGTARARGTLLLEGAAVSYAGDAGLGGVAATALPGGEELMGWKSLELRGIKARAEPFSLEIAELLLGGLHSRISLSPEGRFNLQDLAVTAEGDASPGAGSQRRPVAIGKVMLEDGTIDFADRFVKPNYSAHLTGVAGSVNGLSGQPGTRAEVALKAALEGAPVEIVGSINPLAGDLAMDLKASVRGYDMNLLSPYAAKYVGYGIERGKLSLDVRYRVENRQLNADNRVVLNQLVFGQPVESPDAIKAPVLLALRLLQNSRGEIDVDLPVSGSLDDPQFSVSGLVLRMIGNLIVRVVSAPFAWIGSLFGGSAEELSWIEFEPGASALGAAAKAKIDTLARALNDRPSLTLEIAGRADQKADGEALLKGGPAKPPVKTPAAATEEQLRDLANRRAAEVRDQLGKAGIAAERMFLANPRRIEGEGRAQASPARVDLYLH